MRQYVVALVAVGLTAGAATADIAIVSSWPSPAMRPYGVAYDGTYIWVSCDATAGRNIYRCSPDTGSVISSFNVSTTGLFGCCWDGSYLWYDALNAALEYYLHQSTDTGSVLSSWPSPLPRTVGCTWDGTYLWLSSYFNYLGWATPAGSLVGSFGTTWRPTGVMYDGYYLWTAEYRQPTLYRITTAGSVVASFDFPAGEPWGLGFDGEYMWLTDIAQLGHVYKVDIGGYPAVAPASLGRVRAIFR